MLRIWTVRQLTPKLGAELVNNLFKVKFEAIFGKSKVKPIDPIFVRPSKLWSGTFRKVEKSSSTIKLSLMVTRNLLKSF